MAKKRDRLAEIRRRWRWRVQHRWALMTPWALRNASMKTLHKALDTTYAISEQCHDDLGHVLRVVARLKKAKGE